MHSKLMHSKLMHSKLMHSKLMHEEIPKRGYAINPQLLTIDAGYEKFQMKYDFGNQYAYFSEEIDDQFTEPLLVELDIHVFLDVNHGVFPVPDGTIYLVDINSTRYWGSI